MQVKTSETEGYTALQLGTGEAKAKNVSKPVLMHCQQAGVGPKRKLMEFRVTPDAILPVGQCNVWLLVTASPFTNLLRHSHYR